MRTAERFSANAAGDLPDRDFAGAICERSLRWAAEHDYAGWDPYDGLNAPVFDYLPSNWLTRLVGMHGIHKFPVNLRPLFRVPKERNPKGIALFAMAYLGRYAATNDPAALRKAEELLVWLRHHTAPGFDGYCWGYNFDWQNGRQFFLPADEPSIVVTTFCGSAFLTHYLVAGEERSLDVAAEAAATIRRTINTVDVGAVDVYSYTPYDEFVVINANALAAGFFARVAALTDDAELAAEADDLVDFVLATQTEEGAWYYALPADESHLSHDNFHTGFVLESLYQYLTVSPREQVLEAYERGLTFYRDNLFEDDGAPKFQYDDSYPRDAHAAAQAIRTLVLDGRTESIDLARRVLDWTLTNLYDDAGYFYRRQGKFVDDRTPYMRWSQAWMCYALATYASDRLDGPADRFGEAAIR